MKNITLLITVIIINLGSLSAQNFVGKVNPFPMPPNSLSVDDTVKILAVLVEFKVDDDDASFGDGTFGSIYSQDYGTDILDPLPHDADYFKDHLTFAKNYYSKVSNNQQLISYTVLDEVLTVSKTMRQYSPPINNRDDLSPLVNLCGEVWELADQHYPNVNFSDYDAFTIFHAGTGGDIDVPGSIGNDRDLPSLYFSQRTFQEYLGEEFQGFPVDNGSSLISNTIVLPETESRELSSILGDQLLELTINGLIVASIASHLGLPDLFDTETGLSAIGRFGLMDGQAIFTYAGVFPPEPSVWEKMYLGWITPTELTGSGRQISLTTQRAASDEDTVFIKIPISSSEYFLVENRSRDAGEDGCIVTYKVGGQISSKTFTKDELNFNFANVDTLHGVILDVDEYDWAVPGLDRNATDELEFSDVGIIVWHIDDYVINSKIEDNAINTDKFRRGVDVVEADGIQDIGEEFQTIFGDIIIGEGSKEDTWYSSNPSELYKNIFDDYSKPNSNSNTGAFSLIKLTDFSEVGTRMSFSFQSGLDNVELASKFELAEDSLKWINIVNNDGEFSLITTGTDGFSKYDLDGNIIVQDLVEIQTKPFIYSHNSEDFIFTVNDGLLITYEVNQFTTTAYPLNDSVHVTTIPAANSKDEEITITFGTDEGVVLTYQIKFSPLVEYMGIKSVRYFDEPVKQVASDGNKVAAISENYYADSISSVTKLPYKTKQLALTKNRNDKYVSVVLTEQNSFYIFENGDLVNEFSVNSSNEINKFSLADIKNDGENYIVFANGSNIDAYNLSGSRAEYFPLSGSGGITFTEQPLAIDIDKDGASEIIGFADNGNIYAYSGLSGKLLPSYPLASGADLNAVPVIYKDELNSYMSLVNVSKTFYSWMITDQSATTFWAEEYAGNYNNSFLGMSSGINEISEYFPKSKAYNWPNPVYEGQTNIRFFVSKDSDVVIKIFDVAGDLVEELKDRAIGGFDNEIAWDVSNIQSGVYFAHLNVNSSGGNADYKIIKIAVVK